MAQPKISLFGKGFIGGEFCNQFKNQVVVQDKNDFAPKTNLILNFISTITNYNVKTDPHIDVDTNITLMIRILENARLLYGSDFRFVQISTWFCYGDVFVPATEDMECRPKGFYGITKYAAEMLLRSYCETYGIEYQILRLANVLGKDDKKVSFQKNYTQQLVKLLLAGEPVKLYYGGNFFRDFIDVRDCVQAIKLVMDDGNWNAVYNISNGIPVRYSDVVDFLWNVIGSTSEIENIEDVPFHETVQTKSMYLNNKKLQKLGYKPEYTVFNSLQEIVDAYRAES